MNVSPTVDLVTAAAMEAERARQLAALFTRYPQAFGARIPRPRQEAS